ncbi:MAG: tRNA pseudouridine(55) synthase TruB [Kiritimatiellia bacterium]|nr:tRNA pseudouridine(55) synthase TruB [Lentisphaerota bacterium]
MTNSASFSVGGLPDGVLLVDKPAGLTSHDVVDRLRRRFRIAKVGHAGTLDPQATGLLVIMLGRATKLANRLMAGDKIYEGTLHLGITTDSQDGEGKILQERDFRHVTQTDLIQAFGRLTGDIMQTPPMVSAVKKNGIPLYKLARKGKVVERQPKLIHIYEFNLLNFNPPEAAFRIRCSKGVYVRTICHDVGEALQCGAYLAALRRTGSGAFGIEQAHPLDKLLTLDRAEILPLVIPSPRIPLQAVADG